MDTVALNAALTFLITQGVKGVLAWFGVDLKDWGAIIVTLLVGSLVFFFQGIVTALPEPWGPTVAQFLILLAGVLGAVGTHKTLKVLAAPRK